MKLGILKEFLGKEKNYVLACEDLGIEYEIIDIISNDWIDKIKNSGCDGFLVRPSAAKEVWKKLYDERLYFINKVMKKPIYPSYDEIFIYENKKNMAYWLKTNEIAHPKTWIFYRKNEALDFLKNYDMFPLVFKTNIGSSAIGVKFFNKNQAKRVVQKIFTKWKFFNRGYTKWKMSKFHIPYPLMDDKQHNFVIFQQTLNIKHEWRIIKIGNSYFGHQKLINGKYHSGSGLVGWVNPPIELLDFAKMICDKGSFNSMDIDIFETVEGSYVVNELQSLFGSVLPYQMMFDGKKGRYLNIDGKWEFEEGVFNQNGSCNLRINDFIDQLSKD